MHGSLRMCTTPLSLTFYSTLLYSTLPYPTLLYSTLLYSTLECAKVVASVYSLFPYIP